jgi:hypothetical protein
MHNTTLRGNNTGHGDIHELQSSIMATASTGRPSAVTTDRGFSQFRLTQFVPASNAIANLPNAIDTLVGPSQVDIELMAQAPRPSSGQNIERTPSVAPPRPGPHDHNQANSATSILSPLELVELTSNPLVEGILGPNKDGRVRNPVPSKLKGKTDQKQGNFGVMHMGMSPGKKNEAQGRDTAAERDAAARRTSENTASRAKAAQQEKYIPPKKRGLEAAMNDGHPNRGSPFAISKDDKQRARSLAPDETKFEQARLLTLLRSINPVTVVDQICKAVAYFGGIPGAPPPEDGIFPESANTRETGALFIGWLAEIFPDVSARSPEVPKDVPQNAGKKRGRPSKGGKDTAQGGDRGISNEPPNSRNGYGYGPAISAPAWVLPQSLALVNTPIPGTGVPDNVQASGFEQSKQGDQHSPLTPLKPQGEEGHDNSTSTSKRRRGRPKGSRNKGGKNDAQQPGDSAGQNHAEPDFQNNATVGQQAQSASEAHLVTAQAPAPNQDPPTFAPEVNNQMNMHKPAQPLQYPNHSWQSHSQKNQVGQTTSIPPTDELSPEERAVLEAFRGQGSTVAAAIPSPVVPLKGSTAYAMGGGQKRKRAPPKPKAAPAPTPNPPAENTQPVQQQHVGAMPQHNEGLMGVARDAQQWTSVATSTPTAPPAKKPRQRKHKVPTANDPPSRNQTASVVSSATPPIAPTAIPDSQATSSQQSLPASRPPADGLEAHYERFANLQQQQNGRSHTPTLPQQQVRQQSKPASVPPQQSTPQLQQQQMQQQKSQQGSQQSVQREEQKMAQASSARPSSTSGFYNHRQGSTSYSQQYPSHQPSQLYGGHQASPQMSNNSYRTSSTHTLAQASPQFSQAENTYRTASPHTIAQPSPSFSQTDNNFRTASAHSLAQPSPSFSQAENAYRTPSTHSMAQPTSSYASSRSHSQPQAQASHQSHYNHFSDSSYIDLPTLESLGHPGSSGNASVGMSAGGYGQGLGSGLGASRSTGTSNSLYGTSSGLGSTFDTSTNDLLRSVSRSATNSNSAYGPSSGLGAFETTSNEQEMRERLLRGLGGGRR